jgi:replicative DNA helicase
MTAQRLRTAPQSVAAEHAVLGAMMIDPSCLPTVRQLMQPADHFRREHHIIHRAVLAVAEAGDAPDAVTVSEFLERHERLEQAGGMPYIGELVRNCPSSCNVAAYARSVAHNAGLRRILAECAAVIDACHGAGDALDRLQEASRMLQDLAMRRTPTGFEHVKPILERAIDQIEKRWEAGGRLAGMSSGLAALDELTCGFEPGDLIVVGARPSMGKTALATGIAMAAAADADVGIVSLEMTSVQLANRLMAAAGLIDLAKFRSGRFADDDWSRITGAVSRLAEMGIHIDDTPSANAGAIAARAESLAAELPRLGLLIVDHLQLVDADRTRNLAETTGETSRAMKVLARRLGIPVMLLAQLNRRVEERPNKRPVLSDLRASGGIEQDADLVVFIYRDEVYNETSPDAGMAELIIGKQRNGPTGIAKVGFDAPTSRFHDLAADWAPDARRHATGGDGDGLV